MEELIEDLYTGLKVYTNCKNKTCEVREPATGYSALFDSSFRCLKIAFQWSLWLMSTLSCRSILKIF